MANNLVISLNQTRALILATGKHAVSAMATARAYMEAKESATIAADAMNALDSEYSELPKEKRGASVLKVAIRGFYKNMSTAVSQERARLKAELNEADAEKTALYARMPFRVMRVKGAYVCVTHAEFDAQNGHRQKERDETGKDGGDETNDDGGEKGIDAKAELITSLRAELADMTRQRDLWLGKHDALLAKIDAAKLRAAKPAKAKTKKAA